MDTKWALVFIQSVIIIGCIWNANHIEARKEKACMLNRLLPRVLLLRASSSHHHLAFLSSSQHLQYRLQPNHTMEASMRDYSSRRSFAAAGSNPVQRRPRVGVTAAAAGAALLRLAHPLQQHPAAAWRSPLAWHQPAARHGSSSSIGGGSSSSSTPGVATAAAARPDAAGGAAAAAASASARAPPKRTRLDDYCVAQHPEVSKNVVQSWIAQGKVLVNDRCAECGAAACSVVSGGLRRQRRLHCSCGVCSVVSPQPTQHPLSPNKRRPGS